MKGLGGLEAVSGMLAVVTGGAALVNLAAVPPTLRVTHCGALGLVQPGGCATGTFTLLPTAGSGAFELFGGVAILLLGVGAAAVWHSRTRLPRARSVLWGTTALFAIVSLPLLGLISGPLLLSSMGFAVVACALSLGHPGTPAS
jgi:hypothetical protein